MRYAVSYIDWMDHELSTVIVEAKDWQEALLMHPKTVFNADNPVPSNITDAKQQCFDCDAMMHAEEIPI